MDDISISKYRNTSILKINFSRGFLTTCFFNCSIIWCVTHFQEWLIPVTLRGESTGDVCSPHKASPCHDIIITCNHYHERNHYDERDGVSNHQPHDRLLKRLFRRRSRKKLRVTGFCESNSPMTGEFPAQRSSNAENVSIWWRHQANMKTWAAQFMTGRLIAFS